MLELDELPKKYDLQYLSFYGAVPNVNMYLLLKGILTLLNIIKPKLGWYSIAKFLLSNSKKNIKEPEGYSIILDAWKNDIQKEPELKMILEHTDNYYSTGVIIMLFIKEYLKGDYKNITGVRLMSDLISTQIFDQFSKFGINFGILEC